MMDQRSPDWFAARVGRVTASRVADLLPGKRGPLQCRADYIAQLVCERLTGEPTDMVQTWQMARGTDLEPEARKAYVWQTGRRVWPASFVTHPTIEDAGASPDGLIGRKGLIEIKCPATSAKHLAALRGDPAFATDHAAQVQWQMACTGRDWCDLVSFDPRFPDALQLAIVRIDRDDAAIERLTTEVVAALVEVDQIIKGLAAPTKGRTR